MLSLLFGALIHSLFQELGSIHPHQIVRGGRVYAIWWVLILQTISPLTSATDALIVQRYSRHRSNMWSRVSDDKKIPQDPPYSTRPIRSASCEPAQHRALYRTELNIHHCSPPRLRVPHFHHVWFPIFVNPTSVTWRRRQLSPRGAPGPLTSTKPLQSSYS